MDESGCSLSISNLLCQEDETDLDLALDSPTGEDELYQALVLFLNDASLSDEDHIERLLARESSLELQIHQLPENWFKLARSDAIKWILSTKACLGFSFRTAYLAVAYFDRFFARRRIDTGKKWAIGLLSMACLSVAAKMEECRAPAISDFQIEGFAFDCNAVQRMELLLLDTLQWRMNSVTPFDYLIYIMSKFHCEYSSPEDSLCNAIESIFAAIDVINLATYRSSTIAAAAMLAASSKVYTKEVLETEMSTTSMFKSFSEKEQVYSCYKIMTDQDQVSMRKTEKRLSSSEVSENCSSINDGTIDSASLSLSRNKRRRLHLPSINQTQP
ncbi:cyclin-D5-2-like [Canna indica]|uniref:Cyclin-D5-2-like n=1 Tax=Canna indica TaxID=4628 RepID=A0AAQ3QI16_9LILI|nr:cyclin-D5-2-like [Canna indica]